MKQLLREWDKIGRVKSRVDSEQEVFQVIVLRQEVSGIWQKDSCSSATGLLLVEDGGGREAIDRDLSAVCVRQGRT